MAEKIHAIQKEIFDTVFQWGRVGVATNENCNAFQSLMKSHSEASRLDVITLSQKEAEVIIRILENSAHPRASELKEKLQVRLLKS